jgi:hypothetical protein
MMNDRVSKNVCSFTAPKTAKMPHRKAESRKERLKKYYFRVLLIQANNVSL